MNDNEFFKQADKLMHRIAVMLGENPYYHSVGIDLRNNGIKEYRAYLRVDKLNNALMFSDSTAEGLLEQLEVFYNKNDVDYVRKNYYLKEIASTKETIKAYVKNLKEMGYDENGELHKL